MDGFDIMNKNENMRIQQNRPYVMNRYNNNIDLKKTFIECSKLSSRL
jgi:hypothetical protein